MKPVPKSPAPVSPGAPRLLADASKRHAPDKKKTLPKYQFRSDVVPRLQWNANSGYCGETSFICAGLSFGQYCSQYTARALASPGMAQSDPNSQLLLGTGNDVIAARKMRLQASEYFSVAHDNTPELIVWAKSHLLAGRVPIVGVYNNGIILGEWTGRDDGDPEYDHIVPILGFASASPLEKSAGRYLAGDVITLSDNGLYGPVGDPPSYPFLYSYGVAGFQGTRREANNPKGPIYLLKNKPLNYGIAVEGVLDLEGVTVPVRLSSNLDREPRMEHKSNTPPVPVDIELAATVTIPDQSVAYNLYRYDDFAKVPVANFNAAARNAAQVWPIPAGVGSTKVVKHAAKSDQTVVFRAVPASAP